MPVRWASIRSIAWYVFPVLVGPRSAVTDGMRLAPDRAGGGDAARRAMGLEGRAHGRERFLGQGGLQGHEELALLVAHVVVEEVRQLLHRRLEGAAGGQRRLHRRGQAAQPAVLLADA